MPKLKNEQQDEKVSFDILIPFLIYKHVIGEWPSNQHIGNRVTWQKIGYFAKKLGLIPLNQYDFSWYKKGPYSPGYTSVLYEGCDSEELLNHSLEYDLNTIAKSQLQPLRNLLAYKPKHLSIDNWLELLASIDYLYQVFRDKQKTFARLIQLKPHFNENQVNEYAWNVLLKEKIL